MKGKDDRDKLIAQLKKTPIVQIACERVGTHRATYYRWLKDDKEFAAAAEQALSEGIDLINDMAESQLISAIRDRNISAIGLWLRHNHNGYGQTLDITARHTVDDTLSPEQEAAVKAALKHSLLLREGNGEKDHEK